MANRARAGGNDGGGRLYKSVTASFMIYEQEGRDRDVHAYLAELAVAGFPNVEMRLDKFFGSKELTETTSVAMRVDGRRMPTALLSAALDDPETNNAVVMNAIGCAERATTRDLEFEGVVVVPMAGDTPRDDAAVDVAIDKLRLLAGSLRRRGLWVAVHNDATESRDGGRILRTILDRVVDIGLSLDVEWLQRGGGDPIAFIRDYKSRMRTLHVRQAKDGVWLEDLRDGDVDYRAVEKAARGVKTDLYVVAELNYMEGTQQTRRPVDNLKVARQYLRKVFVV